MAKTGRINFGGGGGLDPDDLNALTGHVLQDKIFGGPESDDPQIGSMPNRGAVAQNLNAGGSYIIPNGYHNGSGKITANSLSSQTSATATAGYIYSGKTAWVNGTKLTGNMTVGSILNFSAAAYSGKQILLKWQNPYAASGKPFSGVSINYSTGSYPGVLSGTRIYTGYGNNSSSGGWSQAIVTLPTLNTTYYFSCTSYCTCSAGDLYGNTINSSAKTQTELWLTFITSQNYTIPAGYNKIDLFAVGGGASGKAGDLETNGYGGGGGGGGYTSTVNNISITNGQVLLITVGSGGTSPNTAISNSGGTSSITRSGTLLCSATGGNGNNTISYGNYGTSGGSGGGSAGYLHGNRSSVIGCNGGSNGNAGKGTDGYNGVSGGVTGGTGSGSGQGSTTRAWGTSNGTLYSGGGGGGGSTYGTQGVSSSAGGAGGTGGGGGGGNSAWTYDSDDLGTQYYSGSPGTSGSANTGGGGGGGGWQHKRSGSRLSGGSGGSGIILIHIY